MKKLVTCGIMGIMLCLSCSAAEQTTETSASLDGVTNEQMDELYEKTPEMLREIRNQQIADLSVTLAIIDMKQKSIQQNKESQSLVSNEYIQIRTSAATYLQKIQSTTIHNTSGAGVYDFLAWGQTNGRAYTNAKDKGPVANMIRSKEWSYRDTYGATAANDYITGVEQTAKPLPFPWK